MEVNQNGMALIAILARKPPLTLGVKKPAVKAGFLNWSAREDYSSLRDSPCGSLLCNAVSLRSAQTSRGDSHPLLTLGVKKPAVKAGFLNWSAREDNSSLRDSPCGSSLRNAVSLRSAQTSCGDSHPLLTLGVKKPAVKAGFLNWSAREDNSSLRDSPCGSSLRNAVSLRSAQTSCGDSHPLLTLGVKKPAVKAGFLNWSAREDSNLRPTGPKPVALPSCATRRKVSLYLDWCEERDLNPHVRRH
jgi:hypothetical protein